MGRGEILLWLLWSVGLQDAGAFDRSDHCCSKQEGTDKHGAISGTQNQVDSEQRKARKPHPTRHTRGLKLRNIINTIMSALFQ